MLACACAQGAVRLQAATLSLPGVHLADVHAQASLGTDGRPALDVRAAKASIPALGWRDVPVTLHGEPQRAGGGDWKFVGHLAAQKASGNALGNADFTVYYDSSGGTLEVDVVQGKSSIHALMPLDQASHIQMKLDALPLAWLHGVLAAAWPDGRLDGGSVDGDVALDLATAGTRVSGRVALSNANLDSKSGTIAAKKLGATGSFRIDTGLPETSLMFDGRLQGGQLALGPLYAQLPQYAVGLHVSGNIGANGIALDSLDFDDPGALRVTGSIGFDRHGSLDKLDLTRFAVTFPTAYDRYGTTLVQNLTGFDALAMSGSINGALNIGSHGPRTIDLTAKNLTMDSQDGSLALANLQGGLDWRAGVSRPMTQLKWDGLAIYKLAFGPASLKLKDQGGALALQQPVSASLFGGDFRLGRFEWRPDQVKSDRLAAAFSVTNVDVNQLCKALGWPPFGGKLGGAVPDLRYRGGNVVLGGGLSLNAFGGSVSVTNLSMQHLFGNMPRLEADIDMQQLDLAQLTGVFGFGEITGRMGGDIHGLQLVDWKPTAFEANLAANQGGKISQNAIKSLTEVGGGGIAGGIQGMALRLFKTFGYSRIGLSCKLVDGVCSMSGITPDPDPDEPGYTIVEGSGLPHITVIGHEHKVDWTTLVSRLKSVTQGNAPIIK
jgi:hypothetical protein